MQKSHSIFQSINIKNKKASDYVNQKYKAELTDENLPIINSEAGGVFSISKQKGRLIISVSKSLRKKINYKYTQEYIDYIIANWGPQEKAIIKNEVQKQNLSSYS